MIFKPIPRSRYITFCLTFYTYNISVADELKENIGTNVENILKLLFYYRTHYEQFILLPQYFQWSSAADVYKCVLCGYFVPVRIRELSLLGFATYVPIFPRVAHT